ncbi:MAG TPA: folate-binding protein [Xanthobacteraceae bacterium]|nr:folate-binding protein [Xanthobacteraceae bacterium]
MLAAILEERAVLRITGDDAKTFLDNVITNDVDSLLPDQARFAGLLTPQGKIVADFLVVRAHDEDGGGFLIDAPRAIADDLAKKLAFYKLRAKVVIEDRPDLAVVAVLEGKATSETGIVYDDPRHPTLGQRIILPAAEAKSDLENAGFKIAAADAYHTKRIALGVPDGGKDFVYSDAYPHEADMDQLNGVDFKKGCFIGQEVVSRMERKTMPRTRIVQVMFDTAPFPGVEVKAGDKPAGHMGSGENGKGIAMVRLDRVQAALAKGEKITAGGIEISLQKPAWARFPFPGEPDFGAVSA